MIVAGYEIGLAEVIIGIGVIALGGGIGLYKLPFSKKFLFVAGICLAVGGAWYGGYIGEGGVDTGEADTGTGNYITEGITGEVSLRNAEDSTAIASESVSLYEEETSLLDIQAAKATPLQTVTTDANGVASFAGLDVAKYVAAFSGDESAFDGTHYMATAKTVEVRKISVLESDETVTLGTLYVKKLGDVFYTITATSASESSSGGVNAAATITESTTDVGTTVHVTISSNTDKAWLTDSGYYNRVYLTDVFTDNGDANTDIELSDCRMNSSSGQNITKDSSASYYVDVTSSVMKNTTKSQNQTFSFTIWVADLGDIGTTADTYAITFKFTLIRKDTTNQTILQDSGLAITITQAT